MFADVGAYKARLEQAHFQDVTRSTTLGVVTEASGLSNEIGSEAALAPGTGKPHRPLHESPEQTAIALIAERLREVAKAAPLRSPAAVFVVGVLIARRR